ncbi:MAG: hypothetical protein ACUVWP_02150 [bacterium]
MKKVIYIFILINLFISLTVLAQETIGEEKTEEVPVVKKEGGVLEFEAMEIIGRIDRPVSLVIERTNPTFDKITFERSFIDDILRPIDKEEFEKQVRESRFDAVANPLRWITMTTCFTTGVTAGYMFANDEKGRGKVLTITSAISGATTLILYLISD